jgi:hypothetical protein
MTKEVAAPSAPRVLSSADAARFLSLSTHTLKAWRRTAPAPIPFVRLSARRCGYLVADLEHFLAARRRGDAAVA